MPNPALKPLIYIVALAPGVEEAVVSKFLDASNEPIYTNGNKFKPFHPLTAAVLESGTEPQTYKAEVLRAETIKAGTCTKCKCDLLVSASFAKAHKEIKCTVCKTPLKVEAAESEIDRVLGIEEADRAQAQAEADEASVLDVKPDNQPNPAPEPAQAGAQTPKLDKNGKPIVAAMEDVDTGGDAEESEEGDEDLLTESECEALMEEDAGDDDMAADSEEVEASAFIAINPTAKYLLLAIEQPDDHPKMVVLENGEPVAAIQREDVHEELRAHYGQPGFVRAFDEVIKAGDMKSLIERFGVKASVLKFNISKLVAGKIEEARQEGVKAGKKMLDDYIENLDQGMGISAAALLKTNDVPVAFINNLVQVLKASGFEGAEQVVHQAWTKDGQPLLAGLIKKGREYAELPAGERNQIAATLAKLKPMAPDRMITASNGVAAAMGARLATINGNPVEDAPNPVAAGLGGDEPTSFWGRRYSQRR